jgi:hypothetical protein
MERDKGN